MKRFEYKVWDGQDHIEVVTDEDYLAIDVDTQDLLDSDVDAVTCSLSIVVEAMRLNGFYIKCPVGFEDQGD